MKGLRKGLIALLTLLLVAVCGVALAACDKGGNGGGGGGTEKYTVTLDADGGELSTTELELAVGENVYNAVKNYEPVKTGLTFGAWFMGEDELAQTYAMPSQDITLKAKYKVGYTLVIYLKQSDGRYTESRRETGSDYVGASVTAPTVEGYVCVTDISARLLSATSADNVITLRYDRAGLEDRFGGNDRILIPDGEAGKAILLRGGEQFEGTIAEDAFTFTLPNKETLKGKIFGDKFAYARDSIKHEYKFRNSYYNPDDPDGSEAISDTDSLNVDEYGTAVHTYVDGTRKTDEGYISYNAESDEYLFTIVSGTSEEPAFVFFTGRVDPDGTDDEDPADDIWVFSTTNGEGGMYQEFITPNGMVGYMGQGNIILDGYGGISFYDEIFTGAYEIEDVLGNQSSSVFLYRIHARLKDNELGQAHSILGYETDHDGYFDMYFYTVPLDDTTWAYVERHPECGEYTNDSVAADKLTLDGYTIFPYSAVYTHGGTDYMGSYTLSGSQVNGLGIVLEVMDQTTGMPTGTTFTFTLDVEHSKFSQVSERIVNSDYVLLVDDDFDYNSLLVIYEDAHEGVENSFEAELKARKSATEEYYTLAKGYVTSEKVNSYTDMFTFTRTEKGSTVTNERVPLRFKYMTSATYDMSFINRNFYYVYEYVYEGDSEQVEKQYVEISQTGTAANKGSIKYIDIGLNTIGAIYTAADGGVYVGGLTIDTSNYFFGNVGTFIYLDSESMSHIFYFDIELDAHGTPTAFTPITELEHNIFRFDDMGNLVTDDIGLVIREQQARYSPSGSVGNSDVQNCTWQLVEAKDNGDLVCKLYSEGGVELFTFLWRSYDFYEAGFGTTTIEVYHRYNASIAKTYTSGVNSLTLDGYYRAEFTEGGVNYSGEYKLSDDGQVVFFTSDDGYEKMIKISGTSLTLLDGVYGRYYLTLGNDTIDLNFNGLGNILSNSGDVIGYYNVIDATSPELDIWVNTANNVQEFIVTFDFMGNSIIHDVRTSGVFVSDDWAVLKLDGYGVGTYYSADGQPGVRVNYIVVNAEAGFMQFIDVNYNYYYFLLDSQNHTFSTPKYLSESFVGYDKDLGILRIQPNGEVWVGVNSGFYHVVDGNKLRIYYVKDMNTMEYGVIESDSLPSGNSFVLDGKTYYRFNNEEVTLTGKIKNKDGSNEKNATLTFKPDGQAQFYAKAKFIVDSDQYDVYVVNAYWDSRSRSWKGLALFDDIEYVYSPIGTYALSSDCKTGTFEIIIDEIVTRMTDGFETETQYSYIEERYKGFGPIRLSGTTVSGSIWLGGVASNTLDFTGASVEKMQYADTSLGYRYMVVFEHESKTYAVQYYKQTDGYQLYMVCTLDYIEVDGYVVTVGKYVYSNGGFTFYSTPQAGDFVNINLYKGTRENKTAVVAYNSLVNDDGKTAWIIDLGTYDPAANTGKLGKAYYLTFGEGLATVEVKEYTLKQAMYSDVSEYYCFVNFFLNDDGSIAFPACVAVFSDDSYRFIEFSRYEKKGDNNWVFYGEAEDYYVTLETEDGGGYKTDSTGEYWQVSLRIVAHGETPGI